MTDPNDPITVTMTREEVERLTVILNSIFRRDGDIEHFLLVLDKALHTRGTVK